MHIDFIDEPELEFGGRNRHLDIRRGLALYGPLDVVDGQTKAIRIGFVGTQHSVDGIRQWLARCEVGIDAKASRQPQLFPEFPGFGADSPFRTTLEIDESLIRILAMREIRKIASQSYYLAIVDAATLLAEEVQAISEKGRPDVVIVALPSEFLNIDAEEEDEEETKAKTEKVAYETKLDLRNMLKAQVMKFNQPIQLVLPSTYGDSTKAPSSAAKKDRRVQDEATRAWNFHTALYYKANRRPWRIVRQSSELHACFVGISFYRTLDRSNLMTTLAQVYDERGEGVIVRGKPVELSKDDRHPHLSRIDASTLLISALDEYRREHKHLPARVVLHKSSSYNADELAGFNDAVDARELDVADFLVVAKAFTRLYREGMYPPLRGTMLTLDTRTHLLYTRGSIPYFATYPGMYIPRPLKFYIAQAEESPRRLAEELLALTKLNWNNTQFDGGEPITMRVAQQVGRVLKYVAEGGIVQPRYSFYM